MCACGYHGPMRWVLVVALVWGCGDDSDPATDGGRDAPRSDTGSDDAGDTEDSAVDAPAPDVPAGTFDCSDPHPSWLLCEDFEQAHSGDLDTWLGLSDFVVTSPSDDVNRLRLSDDQSRSGSWSIHMPGEGPNFQGGQIEWVHCDGEQRQNCDPVDHEELYFRMHVRFAEDHDYIHHFVRLGGRDRFWAYGSAGCFPNGQSEMEIHVDYAEDTRDSFFYVYHQDMGCDDRCERYADEAAICAECADKGFPTCDAGGRCCWGDNIGPEPARPFPVGEWFCLELMMRANTPGENDGVMAYWINGEPGHERSDMNWRSTSDLGLNYAIVQHFIASGDTDHSQRVWFDDVVVSTERIGCN